jgi:glutathione synthase/RimK-type ligase-like ATP-grasp enzyme
METFEKTVVGILIPSLHDELTDYQKRLYSRRYGFFSARGIELVHVALDDFDEATRRFQRFQKMEGDAIVTVEGHVLPPVLWRKMSHSRYFVATEVEPYVPVVPSNRVAEIANNKHATYLAFKKHQPATALVSEYFEYQNVRDRLKGETLILKPTEGYGGKGIRKISKTELQDPKVKESLLPLGMVHVLQEFKDFSKGIPGLVEGVHDFRLDYAGGKISIASIRYPKNADEFRCNVSA